MASGITGNRGRALLAARLVGVCAVGILGQLVVDMPEGYFGPVDRVTPVGATYAAALAAVTAAFLFALHRRVGFPGWLVPAVPAVNVGLFLPAVVSDPLVAGLVVAWNAVLLALQLFPVRVGAGLRPYAPADEVEERLARTGPALRHLAAVGLTLSVAVVGYRLSGEALALGVCLALGYGAAGAAGPLLRRFSGWRRLLVVAVPVAASLAAAPWPGVMLSLLAVAQVVLLVVLLGRQETTAELLSGFFDHPSRLIVASFGGAVLLGTVLLTFPAASAGPEPISPLDALFTATSATCVTGLIVLDTPNAFSPFGQAVILGLIQAGGLGIMTLSTFAAVMLGGTLGLRGERALTEMLDLQMATTAYRITRFIVLSTLAVEAVGAAGLAVSFTAAGMPPGEAVWRGVFHAVSAFCNAGFALWSDSLEGGLSGAPVPVLLHAVLIILGGLGFVVLADVWTRFTGTAPSRVSVQARTVLWASGFLVAAGTVLFALTEWRRSLAGLPVGERLLHSLFQSVTLRTAGFNSVGFADLGAATVLFMIVFMFVGASPGSTGGGIKTTTAAVLLAAIRSMVRREERVRLFEREVPREIVYRSLAITVVSVGVLGAGLFLLLLLEEQPFLDLLFEATSAFATVGLSLGATAHLGPAGKLIIIAVMFVGRIGPLTLALLLGAGPARHVRVRRPETRLMVG